MRLRELWRITTFRITVLYGLVFALGAVALLGLVYIQSTVYLSQRVDHILDNEMNALTAAPPWLLAQRVEDAVALGGRQIDLYALFSPQGAWIAGNLDAPPRGLRLDGRPIEMPSIGRLKTPVRMIGRELASGDLLVVGRDISQLREMRTITGTAVAWSGVSIVVFGVACGAAFSIRPLRRLRILRDAGQEIAGGNLRRRMPVSDRGDELDMFAGTVNHMMGEVERLMSEVKGSTETIAHDLRTPLTRARAQLHRMQLAGSGAPDEIARVTAEIDVVLERFRALLRISELEARERRAGFSCVDLAVIAGQVVELYSPLAEAGGVQLTVEGPGGVLVEADPKLLFEAVSNLVDNAIKFTAKGGAVAVRVGPDPDRPRIVVQDQGHGIPLTERAAVLQRFYRSERDRLAPGSGLGLSIVAAILRLHNFKLSLQDADPGLMAVIDCRPSI
jgi:signal transduction histidine kinase